MPTKKYNIDALIVCDIADIRQTFGEIVPSKTDPSIWQEEHQNIEIEFTDIYAPYYGHKAVKIHICFETEVDRETACVNLRASEDLFKSCELGSYIRYTTNDHSLPDNERTVTGDAIEFEWGKDDTDIYTEDFIKGISQGRLY